MAFLAPLLRSFFRGKWLGAQKGGKEIMWEHFPGGFFLTIVSTILGLDSKFGIKFRGVLGLQEKIDLA
eukprot:1157609-Pelagomonas_calceolata.AAC.4